jgi:transcription initiation factor TFIIE subunit alpha
MPAKTKRKAKPSKKLVKKKAPKARLKKLRPIKVIVNVKKLLLLEEAIKYVTDLSGDKGLEVFKYLIYKGPMEENALAKKLKFNKANAIRKFLYKLYNKSLVSYVRKKRGAKAWYTYYWRANPERLVFLLQKEYEDEIAQAKKSIDLNKSGDFYICNNCNRQYGLTKALENDFRCSNCNGTLSHLEASEVVGEKESRISFLNKKIEKLLELVKTK